MLMLVVEKKITCKAQRHGNMICLRSCVQLGMATQSALGEIMRDGQEKLLIKT